MNYLSVENLTKSFGVLELFEDLSFGIDKGQKVALIARNGTGKTTLLNILTGSDTPDSGEVIYRKGIKVGFLSQTPNFQDELTVMEEVQASGNDIIDAIKEYERCLENPNDDEAVQIAFEKMDSLGAWDYETRIKQILGKLEIHRLDQKIATLSGGQRKRVALAKVLIEQPDLIILDEPTNHLDLQMIEWLENFLSREDLSILMVTHDRYFLERVCDVILEMEDHTIYRYKGNFSYYLEKKEERRMNKTTEVEKARSHMKTELEWMRRQPKARGTKAKSRVDAFDDLQTKANQKLTQRQMELEINMSRLGSKIVEIHKVSKGYDGLTLLDRFEYTFKRGDRIGMIGRNGVGKTTLLNLLTEKEQPDSGKVVIGETVVFGYYTQSGMNLKAEHRVIDVIKDIAEYIPLTKGRKMTAAQLLERFLFDRKRQYDFIGKLSGGEKKRLYLLTILMKNPNFLILDEPTNDLDIMTLAVLEEFLMDFPGILLVVTHDRYFMDKLVDHCFVFEGEGIIADFPGNYSLYRDWKAAKGKVEKKPAPVAKPVAIAAKPAQEKKRLSFGEKREFEQLGKDIETLEARKIELTEYLNSGAADHVKLLEAGDELGKIIPSLENKEMRWLELSEYA
jgi:ATP-binding cassette subfamily F protein uup